MSPFGLPRVGYEFEVPISCHFDAQLGELLPIDKRCKIVAEYMMSQLESVSINCTASRFLKLGREFKGDWKEWNITVDSTTYQQHGLGWAPLEFNTRIMETDDARCIKELEKFESVLCPLLATKHPKSFDFCATHIHLSFPRVQEDKQGKLKGDFPVEAARLIVFASRLFQGVIDNLTPKHIGAPERYAKSNTMINNLEKPDLEHQLTKFPEIWNKMKSIEKLKDLHRMWNLFGGSMLDLQWKTIENRHMPPLIYEGQVVPLVKLYPNFVDAATSIDQNALSEAAEKGPNEIYKIYGLQNEPTDLQDLKQFIMGHSSLTTNHTPFAMNNESWERLGKLKADEAKLLNRSL